MVETFKPHPIAVSKLVADMSILRDCVVSTTDERIPENCDVATLCWKRYWDSEPERTQVPTVTKFQLVFITEM